jgi:hypothetical protein
LNIKTYPYLYLKCGATSPLGKRIPALIKKARAASLLAVEAFLAASNLSCLLLSNKSIFYLLILIIQLSCCKDTLFFWKMQGIIEKCLRMREINRRIKKSGSSPASNNLGEDLTGTALQR